METRRANEVEAERLVGAYADLILRLSYTYLKSTHDAEDICQTVLLKLMGAPARFEGPEHERAWVIRTTANACKDVLRSARRRTSVALDAVAEAAAPEVPDSAVLEAVMELSQPFREALYLHYYEGYTAREIADITIAANDLFELVQLRRLSMALMNRIQSNYRFVIGFNGGLIALGALGVLAPATSATLHNLSTLGISLRSMTSLLPPAKA